MKKYQPVRDRWNLKLGTLLTKEQWLERGRKVVEGRVPDDHGPQHKAGDPTNLLPVYASDKTEAVR